MAGNLRQAHLLVVVHHQVEAEAVMSGVILEEVLYERLVLQT